MSQLTAIPNMDVLILHKWNGTEAIGILPEGFEFVWSGRMLRHKPGGYTDGMSSPQFTHVWKDADPFGWALPAAVPHDGGYHDDLEEWNPTIGWVPVTLTKTECDTMFHDLLGILAAGNVQRELEALAFYEAVHLAGQAAFDEGRRLAAARKAAKTNGGAA